MRASVSSLTQDDTYGPGTDLAMALLGIFVLYMAINIQKESNKSDDLKAIKEQQYELVQEIAASYNTTAVAYMNNGDTIGMYGIMVSHNDQDNIRIENKNSIQTITFGDNLLFDLGQAGLKGKGMEVLSRIGAILKKASGHFEEIQIQGHADNLNVWSYHSNLELASARATTVFTYLQYHTGLDPSSNLMSIVSFGEYKPVQRKGGKGNWSPALIDSANDTQEKRDRNRRIEIVLIYR